MKKTFLCVLFLCLCVLAACQKDTPDGILKVELIGPGEVAVEYGQTYQEPGTVGTYQAFGEKESRKVEVSISGRVDETKLGEYTLRYTASIEDQTVTVTRLVRVVDTKPPQILLVQDPDAVTSFGQKYEEEGFTASDNCDGDITHRVQRQDQGDRILYTVTDASGNETTVIRNVHFADLSAPVLTLLGEREMTLPAGTLYSEPGYTAMDYVDGDVTVHVTVSGEVNSFAAGTYRLEYQVTDACGNSATQVRTVTVEPVRQPDTVVPEGKVIYMTFDDGSSAHTERLLGILAKYNVKVTFFLTDSAYNYLMPQMVREGHSIGIHTISHIFEEIYVSKEAYFADLYGMQDIIYQWTGIRTTLMRFPGGSSNTRTCSICPGIMTELVQAVTEQGFQYFDWNASGGDCGAGNTAEKVFEFATSTIGSRKRAVLLLHDTKGHTVDAVERIIIWGLNNGYTFLPLTPDSPPCHHPVNN